MIWKTLTQPMPKKQPIDWSLLGLIVLLMGIGLMMVASGSVAEGVRIHGDTFGFFKRQLMYVVLSLIAAFLVFKFVTTEALTKFRFWIFGAGLVALTVVLIPGIGHEVKGASRWIKIGVTIQPSEFMKLAFIIFMSAYVARFHDELTHLKGGLTHFIKIVVPLMMAGVLILMEPDLGAIAVIAAIVLGMMFLAGTNIMIFATALILVVGAGALAIYFEPYRLKRLTSFSDPWMDPYGSGFQLSHALMAFGRGEWNGVGLGNSIEKLQYLPDAHTDFLVSVYAEEFGFMGMVFLITLYMLLIAKLYGLARRAQAQALRFESAFVYGVAVWISVQAFINIAMNMGAFPTKGLTLPLFSYGGSSYLAMGLALGFVLRIDYLRRQPVNKKAKK